MLLKAARRLEPLDLELARETYLAAWGAAGLAEPLAGRDVLLEICRAVQALPAPLGDPRPLDLLLPGLALLITDGHAAAAATLQRAAKVLTSIPVEDVLRWGWMATTAYTAVWDFDGLHAISARQVQLVRDAGALAQLPLYLSQLGIALPWMGDFAGAASVIAETDNVAAATGSPIAPYTLLRLRALQGREAEASALIATAIEHATAGGQGVAAAWAQWAAAVLYNGLARYEEAASAVRQATPATVHPWPSMWAMPELVEAAARCGDTELARDALERLADELVEARFGDGARPWPSTSVPRSSPGGCPSRSTWNRTAVPGVSGLRTMFRSRAWKRQAICPPAVSAMAASSPAVQSPDRAQWLSRSCAGAS